MNNLPFYSHFLFLKPFSKHCLCRVDSDDHERGSQVKCRPGHGNDFKPLAAFKLNWGKQTIKKLLGKNGPCVTHSTHQTGAETGVMASHIFCNVAVTGLTLPAKPALSATAQRAG